MYGCGSASTKNELKEDSLEYYPPTPHEISKEEFRMLHRRVEAFYDSILPGKSLNGAFLVAKKGNILFEKYSGTAHLKGKDTITPNTPFHIASTSKTFTAMAILYLVQKKQLGLDDPLQKFFPSFPYEGITVKMLLSQRSALPNYMNVMDREGWDKKQRATNADVLQYFIQYKPALQGTPGRQFTYCNTNFVLLALIIEKVSGKPYGTFLHEVFFRPLKMENTFVFQWSDSARVTPSYRGNGVQEAFTWLDETCGDKNIYSTVRDLLKWDQALYSDKLFDTSLLTAAFTPYSFERPGIHNYGLGWRMYTLPSEKKIIYHNGWWHGNNSCFYRVITDSLTIIVLGNRMNRNIYRVKPLIESVTSLRFAYENGED
jgi:CubicO group peptidase (beta-lactamase class C family)